MKHRRIHLTDFLVTAFSFSMLLLAGDLAAQQPQANSSRSMDPAKARVVEHWTNERRASAIPRDLVIDSRGLGYLRRPDGSLQPYGHQIVAENFANRPSPNARPGGDNGMTAPTINAMDPAEGAVIGSSHTFTAKVTDDFEVRSVSFTIIYASGATQSFNANAGTNDLWLVTLSGFTDGDWSWRVVAKDTAKRGGNTTTSDTVYFSVNTGGGGSGDDSGDPGDGDTVANAEWNGGGAVQTAAGRLYFEMPKNAKKKGPWQGYVCSGTVVTESAAAAVVSPDDRSLILTAAHCVYDDANKAFARNVLFIPNQADTTGSGTDQNCGNDPLGCWVPSFGVVDTDWAERTFPDNVRWDYAFYVVSNTPAVDERLEDAAGTLPINFATEPYYYDGTPDSSPDSREFTYGLGYSYDVDPKFMYCAEDMTAEGANNWWLASCGLSGGSSGGPWVQPMDTVTGAGPVISVNSWGYVGSPGMAGPKLDGSASAECVFLAAENRAFSSVESTDGNAGVVVCP